jgi:hypothetical protein
VRTHLAVSSVFLALLSGLLGACGGGDSGNDKAVDPGAFSGDKTFRDQFDAGSDWPQGASADATYGAARGQFLILITKPPHAVLAGPNEVFGGGQVQIRDSVQKIEVENPLGANAATLTTGLLCRWNEEVEKITGYAFHISNRDGPTWTINRSVDGKTDVLKRGPADFDVNAKVALEAACVGETLVFKIGGKEVGRVTDTALDTGSNGLLGVAVRGQKPPLTAFFDNYELEYDEQLAEG